MPLTVNLQILDNANGCTPLAGAAVYMWHCDIDGRYSLYSQAATDENYLRGVQEADSDGRVTFTSIFPAAYSGRWPHIHFEVYPSLTEATSAGTPAGDVAARPARGHLQPRLRHRRLRPERQEHGPDVAGQGQWSSATAPTQQTPTMSGTIDTGLAATLSVPV